MIPVNLFKFIKEITMKAIYEHSCLTVKTHPCLEEKPFPNRWRQIRSTNEPFFPLLFVNHIFPAVKPNTAVFQCTFSNKIQCYHKSRKMLSSSSISWLFLAKTKNIYDSRTKHTDLMRNDIILCRNATLMSQNVL